MSGRTVMHPAYRAWWRALMDLRPMVRYLAERFPKLAPWGIRVRVVLHGMVGNPLQTVLGAEVLTLWLMAGWPWRWLLGVFVTVSLVLEVTHRVFYRHGHWLIGWREAWRFRRRWPSDWAGVAAKTVRVQAEVGTSKEPIASAVLRPVADHPKLSLVAPDRVAGGVVVGRSTARPIPGRPRRTGDHPGGKRVPSLPTCRSTTSGRTTRTAV